MIKNIKWVLLASIAIVACERDLEEDVIAEVPVTAGEANFSKYVALGDSFGAGYSDNALFVAGQLNSYPEQMARQFVAAGGGAFKSPLNADNIGGLLAGGNQIPGYETRLYFDPLSQSPKNLAGNIATDILIGKPVGPFNNISVSGAKSFHLTFAAYGSAAGLSSNTANPYFVRFASSPSTTMLADAASQNPTFFSLWIGGNDVLSYATSGGVGVDQLGNTNPLTYGYNDITDPNVFANVYSGIVDQMTKNGAKGVVANLPYVSSLPFFTTVPTNPVPALPAANATALNQLFGLINQIAAAAKLPKRFEVISVDDNIAATIEKNNPLLIVDEVLDDLSAQITTQLTPIYGSTTAAFLGNQYGKARHAINDPLKSSVRDYILLPTSRLIDPKNNIQSGIPVPFNVRGVSFPLQDAQVLTIDEVSKITKATVAYNTTILSIANAKGLAFFDAKATMDQLLAGNVRFGNYSITAEYVKGGAFSLDGVHPGPRGQAFIANKMIQAINAKYKSTIRMIDLGKKPALYPKDIPAHNYVN